VADWNKGGFGNSYWEGLFWGFGGQVYDPQTYEPGFESDAGRKAFQLLLQIAQYAPKEAVNWIEDQTFEAWTKGLTFFNPDEWGFSAYQVPSLNPFANQTVSSTVPLVSSTTTAIDTPWNITPGMCAIMGGYGMGVPVSNHPYEAYTFIKYYLEHLDLATQNTAQPPRISILEKYYNQNPVQYQLFDTLVKGASIVNVRPVIPEALQIDAILGEEVVNVLNGVYDANAALKNMDDQIRAIFIKEGKYKGTHTT
jgi:maltose-binding protein MalE